MQKNVLAIFLNIPVNKMYRLSFSLKLINIHFQQTKKLVVRSFSCKTDKIAVKEIPVASLLVSKIKATGPITVADYMKEVLTNPLSGYYMKKDVFGEKGDFITSPEISQMFGEMIAIWFINEWQKIGAPKPLQLVELGAGRGTMMKDILRVFSKLRQDTYLSCHIVEISPELSKLQAQVLCNKFEHFDDLSKPYYIKGSTENNVNIYWYPLLSDVPKNFTCLIAHEFFDALPIHKLQKTENGWSEVLIDIDPDDETGKKFRYVISRFPTPASKLYLSEKETRDHVEVSPTSYIIMQEIAERLEENGGIALVADYGHDGQKK
uniref:Protein arginine methyltransferase NDUFAF7 n=1 Tax=Clastoptera arizonana TaxID=38151 RepID=A0A1B6BY44_9HEMI